MVAGVAAIFLLTGADNAPSRDAAVGAAQNNLTNARVAVQAAEKFRDVAHSERSAALGKDAHAPYDVEKSVAANRLRAADAKIRYADDLVTLRRQEVELRQAELDLARARANLAQFDRLYRGGAARSEYTRLEAEAKAAVRQKRATVDATRATLETGRRDWTEIHHVFDVAARRTDKLGSDAPLPPID